MGEKEMLITDYLFENVKPIWDAYLEHDFIMDMKSMQG